MSPKSGKPLKTTKKSKKLSEKEKIRKKKEDADRLSKEEEESRIKAEQEEAEQRAKEALVNKEIKKREKQEKELIAAELPKLQALESMLTYNYFSSMMKKNDSMEWNSYLNPELPPSPLNIKAVNIYFKNNKKENSNNDLYKHLKISTELLELTERMLEHMKENNGRVSKSNQVYAVVAEIEAFVLKNMDACTHNFMSDVKSRTESDSDYVAYETSGFIDFCIWANITKNPRTKGFEVEEKGLFFEVTPFINRLSCCIRIIFCAFESHKYSKSTSTTLSITSHKSEAVSTSSMIKSFFDLRTLKSTVVETSQKKLFPKIMVHETTDEEANTEMVDQTVNVEEDSENEDMLFIKFGLQTPPGSVDFETKRLRNSQKEEGFLNRDQMYVVGGIFIAELFQLPDQPKILKNWTIQTVIEPPQLFPIPYGAETRNRRFEKSTFIKKSNYQIKFDPSITTTETTFFDQEAESVDGGADVVQATPIMFSFRLPNGVVFFDPPVVGKYEMISDTWQQDQVTDVLYNEGAKQISFKLYEFGTFALFQDCTVNMPYSHFLLAPSSEPHTATLKIKGVFVDVEFTVKKNEVCLSHVSLEGEFDHLLNKFMSLSSLHNKMEYAGLNFFDNGVVEFFLTLESKNRLLLDRIYNQMGLVAFQTAFKSSRWNHSLNNSNNKLLMQMLPCVSPTQPLHQQNGWVVVEATKKHVAHLKMQEADEDYSFNVVDDHFHSNLYNLVYKMSPFDEKNLTTEAHGFFALTLSRLLKLTNPLFLAKPPKPLS